MKFFRYLWLSCSGFRTYALFLNLPLKSTLAYWAALSALLGAALMLNMLHWFELGYGEVQRASAFLPEFSLVKGEAFSKLPQPYFETNQFPIILDLQDSVKAPESIFPTGVAIRKRELQFWSDGVKPMVMPWREFPDGTINAEYLQALKKQIMPRLPWFYVPIWLTILLLGLIQAFLFTVLAGFLERSMQPSFSFSQLFNLAVFALTPGSIIIATYVSAQFYEVRYDLLYFACYCFFLVMASGACRTLLLPLPPPREPPGD